MKTKKQSVYGKKRSVRFLFGAVLSVLMLCCLCLPASAAGEAAYPDPGRTGSIRVTLSSDFLRGTVVTNGTLTLFHVADLRIGEKNRVYAYTEEFSDCEADPDGDDPGLAEVLAEYAAAHGIHGAVEAVGEDGCAVFPNLSLGLYLIVQSSPSEGYYAAEPFLVTLPLAGENGWEYDVDASPKMEELKKLPEETETSEFFEEYEDGEEDEERDEDASSVPGRSTGSAGGGDGSGRASGTLPQTGQLNWPIPLLTAAGLLLILLGLLLRREMPWVLFPRRGIH